MNKVALMKQRRNIHKRKSQKFKPDKNNTFNTKNYHTAEEVITQDKIR